LYFCEEIRAGTTYFKKMCSTRKYSQLNIKTKKDMNTKKWYYSILMLCCLTSVLAQETTGLRNFPAQISIVYPVGTHGRQSSQHTYSFSLNLFTGRVGGVNGLEFSGLYGQVDGNVRGIQVAGLGNVVGNRMTGIQMSGFANVVGDNVRGIQVSGFTNVVGDEMKGIQMSGFANVVGDYVRGIQIGGFANVVGEGMNGVQIAGVFNRTKTLNGLQIGLISITDIIESGASLSLVNIVRRDAYKEWKVSFSDYANIALSYKMGTQKLYTIYTVGTNFIKDDLGIVGLGFGNRTSIIGSRFDFQPELVSYNYFPTNFKNIQNTFATHLKLGFVYNINEKYGLLLAPSVYVMNAKKHNDSDFYNISPIGAFYTNESGNRRTTIGAGVSLGLSIR
jgi:hypothetical protein